MNNFKLPTFSEHLNEAKSLGKRGMIFKDKAGEILVYDRVYRKPGSSGRGQENKTGMFVFYKYTEGMKHSSRGPGSGYSNNPEQIIANFDGLEKISDSISKYEKANSGIDVKYIDTWKFISKHIKELVKSPYKMIKEYEDIEYQLRGTRNFFKYYLEDPTSSLTAASVGAVYKGDYLNKKLFIEHLKNGTNEMTQKKIDAIAKKLSKEVEKLGTNYDYKRGILNYEMQRFSEDEEALASAAIREAEKEIRKANLFDDDMYVSIVEIHDVKGTSSANGHTTSYSSYVGGTVDVCGKEYKIEQTVTSSETTVHQSYWN